MGRTKVLMTAAVIMTAMMMSGCGEEAYTLTDNEKDLIVNYSAHVVTKYNTYQKEGLTYVWEDEAEDEVDVVQTTEPTNTEAVAEDGTVAAVPEDTAENDETVYAANAVTLDDFFEMSGIEIDYVGARLAVQYAEDDYYVLYPDSGKQYLVLGFDITNTGEAVAYVNNLEKAAKFQATINGETTVSSELTLLLQDFSTFEATLRPGETRETVLLFQVPATVTSVDRLSLFVKTDDNYQIILENE